MRETSRIHGDAGSSHRLLADGGSGIIVVQDHHLAKATWETDATTARSLTCTLELRDQLPPGEEPPWLLPYRSPQVAITSAVPSFLQATPNEIVAICVA